MTDTTNGADLSASEDFAAFEASIDNPTSEAPEKAVAAEGQGEPEVSPAAEDDATEPAAEPEGDPAPEAEPETKPKQTVQQRINELTWKAAEAERREKAAQERLEAALSGQKPEPEQRHQADDGAPDPSDYEFGEEDAAYIRDQARYEVRQEVNAERQREDQQRAIVQQVTAFEAKAKSAFPDGDPPGLQAYRTMGHNSQALNDIVLTSDSGPQLADYYGANTEALRRLEAMPQHLQVYEIMKVEGRLTAATASAAESTPEPKPKPKIATDAPAPAPQVRGAGGQFKVSPDTDDFSAFEKAYP